MTFPSENASASAPSLIGWVFESFGNALSPFGGREARMRQCDALMALSNEDLARRGLRRDEIGKLVFATPFGL